MAREGVMMCGRVASGNDRFSAEEETTSYMRQVMNECRRYAVFDGPFSGDLLPTSILLYQL
jgi:hypothetical protein